jgi:hypothetical protein
MIDIRDLESTISRLMTAAADGTQDVSLQICNAYNRFASSTALVPTTHPAIRRVQPAGSPSKYNFHIWWPLRTQNVIVRSPVQPEAIFAADMVRVKFGYYPQNPDRAWASHRYVARLNVFVFPDGDGPGQPTGGDLFLVWLLAVEREILREVLTSEVEQQDCSATARIQGLRIAASRHHGFLEPVRDAIRRRALPEDLTDAPDGVKILAEFPHVALWTTGPGASSAPGKGGDQCTI